MGNTVTGTVDEKDGVLVVGEGDKATRYVKESDLLAVKGARVTKEEAAAQAEAAKALALTEASKDANVKLEAEHQKALQAEARVSSLEAQIKSGGGTAAELATAKAELATAKSSSEILGNKYLELKRETVIKTYGVPKATVEKKSLQDLELFEEALKAVVGNKSVGNYAAGGGSGGASPTPNKSPMELAVDAYSSSNKK